MSNDLRSKIEEAVRQERNAQDSKWGEQNHSDERWLVILMEEVGEVAQALLNGDRTGGMLDELVQVSAVAQAAIESKMRQMRNPKPCENICNCNTEVSSHEE